MFERFTERARKVVVLAQEEPGRLRHDYVGTEHLLLGLIREEEGVAARAPCACGATLDGVREEVESIVGYGEEGTPPQAPFTPRTNKVLQHALSEALQLGHDHVGTEHILLGLVRESEGVAARVLSNLDVDPGAVRREVIRGLPDGEDAFDAFYEVERRMEAVGRSRTPLRGRVGGIRAELNLPRPVAVTANADYAYLAPAGFADGAATVEPGDVADLLRTGLQEADSPFLEAVITMLDERLLDSFPAMLEVDVTPPGPPEPGEPPDRNFSVSATFRR